MTYKENTSKHEHVAKVLPIDINNKYNDTYRSGQVYRSNELDTGRHDQRQEAGIIEGPLIDENHRPES